MLGKATVGLFFLLLVWGNLVAGMKAGLACPDWPLCHGRVLPPFRLDIYMEFGHRVIAALAGGFLLVLSYRRFRSYRGAAKAVPAAAVGLVAAASVIGGLVVLLGLPVRLTTLHFMTALTVFLLALYMSVFDGEKQAAGFALSGPASLFLGLGLLLFFQAALGAYVRHSGAGLACPDFPACQGSLIPPFTDGHTVVHYSHRALGFLILLTTAALYAASRVDIRFEGRREAALALFFLSLVQMAVGGTVVLSGLYFPSAALHLGVALMMLTVVARMWMNETRVREVQP